MPYENRIASETKAHHRSLSLCDWPSPIAGTPHGMSTAQCASVWLIQFSPSCQTPIHSRFFVKLIGRLGRFFINPFIARFPSHRHVRACGTLGHVLT